MIPESSDPRLVKSSLLDTDFKLPFSVQGVFDDAVSHSGLGVISTSGIRCKAESRLRFLWCDVILVVICDTGGSSIPIDLKYQPDTTNVHMSIRMKEVKILPKIQA